MKMKLLLVMGLIASSLGLALLFSSGVSAAGETYKWIDANTIQASGGSYSNKIVKSVQSGTTTATQPVQTVTFKRDGTSNTFKADTNNIFYTTSGGVVTGTGKCDLQLSLTIPNDNVNSGSLKTNNSGTSCNQSGLDLTTSLADTGNATKGATATPPPAGATATPPPPPPAGADSTGCNIEAIGWIVCPVVRFMAKIVDGAYAFVSSLLEIQPLTATAGTADQSIYGAWTVMRNFANIAFVIAFMFIIYSQLTSFGLNNYGVKKMLPRLIVAAILVNASFWICALAVDISNILGASLNGLFKSIPIEGAKGAAFTVKDPSITGSGWQGLVGGIIASTVIVGVVLYVTLSALVPAILAAFIAIITVFLVLAIRQALVILLIVVSPLAFVAYLLPNTESLYKKWLGLFKTMLLMYPVIALLFGASALASKIIMTSAKGDYALAIQIMGALISIVPLALTPIVMKTAGGLLNRIGGSINNPNKGPFDRMRKGAEGYKKNRQEYRNLKAMNGKRSLPGMRTFAQRKAERQAVLANRKSELSLSSAEYVAGKASENSTFAEKLAEGAGQGAQVRAVASAESQLDKIHLANVDAQEAVIKNARLEPGALQALSQGGTAGGYDAKNNPALQQAAQRRVFNTGDMEGINQLLDQSGSWNKTGDAAKDAHGAKMQQRLADTIESSKFRPAYIGQGAIAGIRDGKVAGKNAKGEFESGTTSAELMKSALQNNSYSPQKIATGDKSELETVLEFTQGLKSNNPDEMKMFTAMKAKLAANANTALTDPRLSAEVSKNLKVTQQIAALAPQNPPTTQVQASTPQQPDILTIKHDLPTNPNISRTSLPPNSGSATILNPKGPNDNRK